MSHCSDIAWAWCRLKSPATPLSAQPVIQSCNKEKIKFPHQWPFVGGIHQSPLDSLTKGQYRGKGFHIITSSFLLHVQAMYGVATHRPRWRSCVGAANENFGMAVGRLFVETKFDEDAKNVVGTACVHFLYLRADIGCRLLKPIFSILLFIPNLSAWSKHTLHIE